MGAYLSESPLYFCIRKKYFCELTLEGSFLIWQQLMKIFIQANETDHWNLSSILFRYESTAVKETGKLFWSWRSAVPWQRVRTTQAGSNCIHLEPDYKLQCSLLLPSVCTCHWGRKWYTNWEWDFFSQKEGVMIWIVVTPQMLHIEILIPKLTVSADESLGRWLDHKVGILSFQSGHHVFAWLYILWGRTKEEGAIFETTK